MSETAGGAGDCGGATSDGESPARALVGERVERGVGDDAKLGHGGRW